MGLLGVTFIAGCCHFLKVFRGLLFYFLLASVALVVVLCPIGNDLAVVALVEFIFSDNQKVMKSRSIYSENLLVIENKKILICRFALCSFTSAYWD